MTQWFCSDHHLDHENIIGFSHRPFQNAKEMNEALLTYHNERVKPEDHVSFLGDITLRRGGKQDKDWFIKEVRKYGHKRIYLGNHDHFPIHTYIDAGFEKVYATWRDEGGLLFSHFPLHPRSLGSAKANVHGHTHEAPDYPGSVWVDSKQVVHVTPYINICVERTAYAPITLEEVWKRVKEAKDGGL